MDDALLVCGFERFGNLMRDLQGRASPLGVLRKGLGQNLDGHLPAEVCVDRTVPPHTAHANLRGHFVGAETGACLQQPGL